MARKKATNPTNPTVYTVREYAIMDEPSPIAEIEAEADRRRLLWNRLVEIGESSTEAVRQISSTAEEEVRRKAMADELGMLRKEVRDRNAAVRGKADISDLKPKIKAMVEQLKAVRESAKEGRKRAREAAKVEIDAIKSAKTQAVKDAYQNSGLYWGNYNDVIASFNTAYSAVMKTGDHLKMKPHGLGGTVLSVLDTSNPRSTTAIWEGHSLFQLRKMDHRYDCIAKLRYGTGEDRQPLWATFRVRLHRPVPDGLLRKAAIVRRKLGRRWRWSLTLTVEIPAPAARTVGKTVAVDIGWRKTDEGLRVAYYADDKGGHGALLCPDAVAYRTEKCRELNLTLLNHTKAMAATIGQAVKSSKSLPPEIHAALMRMRVSTWESPHRLYRFCMAWGRGERIPGDEAIRQAALTPIYFPDAPRQPEGFIQRYNHLNDWEANNRDKALAHRKDQYRNYAASLLKDAKKLILEKFNLSRIAQKPESGEEGPEWNTNSARVLAAPYEFRLALVNYAKREGVEVVEHPAAHTTRVCSNCGSDMVYNQAEDLNHTCETCGVSRDQDYNAALNLLGWGSLHEGGGDGLKSAGHAAGV